MDLIPLREAFPENRSRLIAAASVLGKGIILLQGWKVESRNADTDQVFRQESNFQWATGCDLPMCVLVVDYIASKSIMFYKFPTTLDIIWSGGDVDPKVIEAKYKLEEVRPLDTLTAYLDQRLDKDDVIFTIPTQKPIVDLSKYRVSNRYLLNLLYNLRDEKTEKEITILRQSAQVSAYAHLMLMKESRFDMMEFELEALFNYHCSRKGLRSFSYQPIVGSGYNSAILHYIQNDRKIQYGDLVLVDAGNELLQYSTDITRTFPVSGKFSEKQKVIYSIVLTAFKSAMSQLKPGASWSGITVSCQRELTRLMLENKFLIGNLDELVNNSIIKTFMPHGLGHMVGLDVHDTTIVPSRALRKGYVLTVEPGIYFNKGSLEQAKKDPNERKYYNWDKIALYTDMGGVRIEDTVLITEDGCETLIKGLPIEIEDIEKAVLSGYYE